MEWIDAKKQLPKNCQNIIAYNMHDKSTGVRIFRDHLPHDPVRDFSHWIPVPEVPMELCTKAELQTALKVIKELFYIGISPATSLVNVQDLLIKRIDNLVLEEHA